MRPIQGHRRQTYTAYEFILSRMAAKRNAAQNHIPYSKAISGVSNITPSSCWSDLPVGVIDPSRLPQKGALQNVSVYHGVSRKSTATTRHHRRTVALLINVNWRSFIGQILSPLTVRDPHGEVQFSRLRRKSSSHSARSICNWRYVRPPALTSPVSGLTQAGADSDRP